MKVIDDFLNKYEMSVDNIDIDESLKKLDIASIKGLSGVGGIKDYPIPMIPTYLNPDITLKKNEKVIVVDAGGTNLRVGVAKYDGVDFKIIDSIEDKMPGLDREYTKDEFFDYIALRTKPFLDQAINIGFCFSYRVQMNKDLDGRLIAWAKEIKAKEVVDTLVGEELLKAIKKYSNVDRKIVVLNDTTAVLLGGIPLDINHECEKYVGAIYGTGFNCCYIEDVKNIKKLNDSLEKSMIINTETGNFNGFPKGLFDIELTNESNLVEEALTEKMTSGRYLSTLIYKTGLKAIEDGLLDINTKLVDVDLAVISKYLSNNDNSLDECFINKEDIIKYKEIANALIKRASKIVAIVISSFVIKSNSNKVGIIIEGSTFYKLKGFKENFNLYLDDILRSKNIEYQLFDGRGRILIGAALASMLK